MHHPVDDLEPLDRAAQVLRLAQRVAVMTGAGVSAESGVPTFRGGGGLWEGHSLQDVATPDGFSRDPALVWRFYNARRNNLRSVLPNPGHTTLADMERRWGADRFTLITQNIDGLHQAAGSTHVLELHGSLARVRCSRCSFVENRGYDPQPDLPACPECGHLLRPDVVWFGEILPGEVWEKSVQAVGACDCMLVVGTSAVVYPAAGLIEMAIQLGATVIIINLEATPLCGSHTIGIYGSSGTILPEIMAKMDEKGPEH